MGSYHIVNLETGAFAGLLNDNDQSEVASITMGLHNQYDRGLKVHIFIFSSNPCENNASKWLIKHLRSDEYMIQNVDFQSYASYDPAPRMGDAVLGKWDTGGTWRVRVVSSPNVFM